LIQDDGSNIGINSAPNGSYQVIIGTSINDGTLALDSSSSINALYLLKSGTKKFEISYDTSSSVKLFRLLPYETGSSIQIGNPSNAANGNSDYVFISESTYGNVMIGPGLANGLGNLTGATAATHKVQIKGAAFFDTSIACAGDITAYYSSDERFKNNIVKIDNPLWKISQLNGVIWEWNDNVEEDTKKSPNTGLIAQDVQKVLPEVVKERDNGYLALDYQKMAGLFVEAIKELTDKVASLEEDIKKLKDL
jgi:hypothetical protein